MSKRKEKKQAANSNEDALSQSKSTSRAKEEKEDIFISFSERLISFIEKKRKAIIIGFISVAVLVSFILVLSFLQQKERERVSDLFYEANLNIFDKIQDAGDEVNEGGGITDDEIARLVKGNKKLIQDAGDKDVEEVYLSKYTLGITYYSIGDYDNASYYFKEAYKHKDDFYLSFQALLNLGHSLYNRGYGLYKKGKYEKALESYKATLKTYTEFKNEYVNAPSVIFANRYLGLLSESFADLHTKMGGDKKKVKDALIRSKKHYEEYLKVAKNKEGKLKVDFMSEVFMRRGIVEDASLLIRGVSIKLEKL